MTIPPTLRVLRGPLYIQFGVTVRGDAWEFVEAIPGSEFMTEGEKMEAADLLQPGLDIVGPGAGGDWYERNQDLRDFFDYMGLDENSPVFWEAFREWYGETG